MGEAWHARAREPTDLRGRVVEPCRADGPTAGREPMRRGAAPCGMPGRPGEGAAGRARSSDRLAGHVGFERGRAPSAGCGRISGDRRRRLVRRKAAGPRPLGPVDRPRVRREGGGGRARLRRTDRARRGLVAVRQDRFHCPRDPRHARLVDGPVPARAPALQRRRLQLHRPGIDGPRRARRLHRRPLRPGPRRHRRRRRRERRQPLARHPGPVRTALPAPLRGRRLDHRRNDRPRRPGDADRRARLPRPDRLVPPPPGARTRP